MAIHTYNKIPRSRYRNNYVYGTTTGTCCEFSVWVQLLPFIEASNVYEQFNFNQKSDSTANIKVCKDNKLTHLLCPSGIMLNARNDVEQWTTHYYGIDGPMEDNLAGTRDYRVVETGTTYQNHSDCGMFGTPGDYDFSHDVDGLSNTLSVGEISWELFNSYRGWHLGFWSQATTDAPPLNIVFHTEKSVKKDYPINCVKQGLNNPGPWGSEHPGGAQFGVGDGSVRFLSETMSVDVLMALASVDGGESESLP